MHNREFMFFGYDKVIRHLSFLTECNELEICFDGAEMFNVVLSNKWLLSLIILFDSVLGFSTVTYIKWARAESSVCDKSHYSQSLVYDFGKTDAIL